MDKPKRKSGGRAFPRPAGYYPQYANGGGTFSIEQQGMTLRDYFACAAMQGWLANTRGTYIVTPEMIAAIAYDQADAMLEQREK